MNKDILYFIVDISMGDCEIKTLLKTYPEKLVITLLDYMKQKDYIFIVEKELIGNIEQIRVVDREIKELDDGTTLAIEFTAKGRKKFLEKKDLIKELKRLFKVYHRILYRLKKVLTF